MSFIIAYVGTEKNSKDLSSLLDPEVYKVEQWNNDLELMARLGAHLPQPRMVICETTIPWMELKDAIELTEYLYQAFGPSMPLVLLGSGDPVDTDFVLNFNFDQSGPVAQHIMRTLQPARNPR